MSLNPLTAAVSESADGRSLVQVEVVRRAENPAAEPNIEIILQVLESDSVRGSAILFPLSVTRTDTREPVVLTDQELQHVLEIAVEELTPGVLI